MGFFDFLKGPDINQGVKEYSVTDGAVLLDVRTPDEYRQGHISGSKNIPLQSINKVAGVIDNKATPFCSLSQRRKKPSGSCYFAADGLYQCEKHRRNFRLCRKGGTLI